MPDRDSSAAGPRVTERGYDRLIAENQRNIEKRLCAEAERDRLRELLSWAIGWIDHTREAPFSDDDEREGEQDRTMYERAHEAIQ